MSITYKNIKKTQKKFDKLEKNLKNPGPAMKVIAGLLDKDVNEHFQKTQGPDGRWAPLKHRQGKPLQDKGTLRLSIQQMYSKTTAMVYTRLVYARMQNFGAKKGAFGKNKNGNPIPWGNVPARTFMWLSNKMKAKIVKNFFNVLVKVR